MTRGVLTLTAVLLLGACDDFRDNSECSCGTIYGPSILKCSARDRCEGGLQLVGHTDLGARGMNSALAIVGNYGYIGSRTDGVSPHPHATIGIVDLTEPTNPQQVGELRDEEYVLGLSSRELRAVSDLKLLYVLNVSCTPNNACSRDVRQFPHTGGIGETENLKIFDVSDPLNPVLKGRYDFANHPESIPWRPPHEFFLWRDPNNPARVLLYVSRWTGPPSIEVIDATDPANPVQLATYDAIDDDNLQATRTIDDSLHSLTVSDDGTIAYLAHFGVGFFMVDTSEIAMNVPSPKIHTITPVDKVLDYSPPFYPGTHSAVKVPGRDIVVLTDEILPADSTAVGCPWGWAWLINIADPMDPEPFYTVDRNTQSVIEYGQMRLPSNDPRKCPGLDEQHRVVKTAHNPTVTPNLAIFTWYGEGVQIFDTEDVWYPRQVAAYYPSPIPKTIEVDELGLGGTDVLMWSHPIIRDGLIYVVDIRDGLYILKYSGPHEEEITPVPYLEGNSNLR